MRRFTGFLIFLLILTACTTPAVPTESAAPTLEAVMFDGTFETSLLVTEWQGSQKGSVLFPLDPARGAALPAYEPISLGYSSGQAFSPDRQTLAIVSFPDENTYNGDLLLLDLPAWKIRRIELKLRGWVNSMTFSPNGRQLAIAHGSYRYMLTMIDIEQGAIMTQRKIDTFISRLKFTQDSERLMLYKPSATVTNGLNPDPPQVLLLDAQKLNTLWSAELEDVRDGIFPADEAVTQSQLHEPGNALYLSPGLVFAPNGNRLHIVHANSDQLTTIDFEAREIATVKIQSRLSWFEQLISHDSSVAYAKIADGTSKQVVISPDGQFLYVTGVSYASYKDQQGTWQVEQTPLGLEILQTSDGGRVERFETNAAELSLSPDGRFLYMRAWGDGNNIIPWTEIFDTSSRKLIIHKDMVYASPALLMNGEFVLVSNYVTTEKYQEQNHMSILQPSDLKPLSEWTDRNSLYWLTTP